MWQTPGTEPPLPNGEVSLPASQHWPLLKAPGTQSPSPPTLLPPPVSFQLLGKGEASNVFSKIDRQFSDMNYALPLVYERH